MIYKGKRNIITLGCLDLPLGLIWGISRESVFFDLLEFLGTDELLSSDKDLEEFEIDYSIINNMHPKSVAENIQILPLYGFEKIISTAHNGIFVDFEQANSRIRKLSNTPIPEWQSQFLNEHLEYDLSTNEGIEEMVTIGASLTKEVIDKLNVACSEIGISKYSDTHFICCELFKSGVSYSSVEDLLHFMLNSEDMYSPKVILMRTENSTSDTKHQHLIGHPIFNENKLAEYIYNIENGNEQFDYFDLKLLNGKIVRLHSTQVLMPLERKDYDEFYT